MKKSRTVIYQVREKSKLTQLEMAKKLKISQSSLSRYETGMLIPDARLLAKMIQENLLSKRDLGKVTDYYTVPHHAVNEIAVTVSVSRPDL